MNINRLVICEIFPEEGGVNTSTVLKNDSLEQPVQTFFKKHIDKIYNSTGTRSGRFDKPNSTSLKTFQAIFSLIESPFNEDFLKGAKSKMERISNSDITNISDDDLEFYAHCETLTQELLKNIQKSIKKEFLLIILHCTHDEHDELIAVLKMEKLTGVQYSQGDLKAQLNLLPSYSQALQKGALIFKENLKDTLDININHRGNPDENIFHTKFRDTQDDTIAKYFMTGFLDNIIINRDKENTTLAKNQICIALLPYLNTDGSRKKIIKYIEDSYSVGTQTSVNSIVFKLINESKLIDNKKIQEANVDSVSLSDNIYEKMLDSNPTASSDFCIDYQKVEKINIKSKGDNGRLLKFSAAKTLQSGGDVIINAIEIKNDYYYIGIKKNILDVSDTNIKD